MDLCNGVYVYARQWINIGVALNSPGPKDLIPVFNSGFYLRFDIRLYIVYSSFPPFLLSTAVGTFPKKSAD